MLTLSAYLMGRDVSYKDEWTLERQANALDLVKRVNNLFTALQIEVPVVTSGWRPLAVNMRSGGAKRSLHMEAKAVDLVDCGPLKETILKNHSLLLEFGLWMEDPSSTATWCHLDTGIRSSRLIRTFKP